MIQYHTISYHIITPARDSVLIYGLERLVVIGIETIWMGETPTSYGPAGCALPPHQSQESVWVASCPTSKNLLWVDLCPSPKSLSWVGLCPALNMLPWVGSLSPLATTFHDLLHTSHVYGLTAFLFPRRHSNVARVSSSFAATEVCTSRGSMSHATDTFFASGFAIPIERGTGSADALAAATPIAQPSPLSRRSTEQPDTAASTDSTVSVSALLGTPAATSWTTRRRTATATGNAPPL